MPLPSPRDSDLDARWAAWLARGAANDRAVRRRFLTLGPAVFIAAGVVYLIFMR